MLRRLSLQKFFAYAKPFKFEHHQTHGEITWHNGSKIYAISADKPKRLEGVKANWIWIDEVFQVSEHLFTEAVARVSDQQGKIWVTGSLGVQYQNPKKHWVYKYFKEKNFPDSDVFEWTTADNPHFPRDELHRLKDTLDPRTYRQMFTIDWSVPGNALVYDEFGDGNVVRGFTPDPTRHEISVSIDWGWAHEMACLFFAYDRVNNSVYLFDEIISSKMKLEQLWERIKAKNYNIKNWYCDIAGNQEREQTGRSNVQWFRDAPRNIDLQYRKTAVNFGVALVRTYVKNGLGQCRFFIDEVKCPKSLDGILNYSYPEKDGVIINENPLKKDDDAMDAIRYFFVNRLDKNLTQNSMTEFDRWGKWNF
jgi:PBSX family phage terminase large subunit